MKIAIIGYSGSGKSTLARALGERLDCPVLHLDSVYHGPGWSVRPDEEVLQAVENFLEHDAWVVDGTYSRFHFERRMSEADRIIILSFNRFACLWRVWKRYRHYRGQSRPDIAEGCPEKLDWVFVRRVLIDGRSKTPKQRLKKICEKYSEKIVILKNQHQIDRFLEEFPC